MNGSRASPAVAPAEPNWLVKIIRDKTAEAIFAAVLALLTAWAVTRFDALTGWLQAKLTAGITVAAEGFRIGPQHAGKAVAVAVSAARDVATLAVAAAAIALLAAGLAIHLFRLQRTHAGERTRMQTALGSAQDRVTKLVEQIAKAATAGRVHGHALGLRYAIRPDGVCEVTRRYTGLRADQPPMRLPLRVDYTSSPGSRLLSIELKPLGSGAWMVPEWSANDATAGLRTWDGHVEFPAKAVGPADIEVTFLIANAFASPAPGVQRRSAVPPGRVFEEWRSSSSGWAEFQASFSWPKNFIPTDPTLLRSNNDDQEEVVPMTAGHWELKTPTEWHLRVGNFTPGTSLVLYWGAPRKDE